MRWLRNNVEQSLRISNSRVSDSPINECGAVRAQFSDYLDGAVSGVQMSAISQHLEACGECGKDFQVWREVQRSLGELGPKVPPARLQARLRAAIAAERERGAHLPLFQRALLIWRSTIAPVALRLSGGFAVTLILSGTLCWIFGTPLAVLANDDGMAHLVAPRYMYSQVPPEPISTQRDVPIVVDAMVDSSGRVYRYTILEGPKDDLVKVRVENNLLSSIFTPATVFGVPVKGHVVMTYTGISVRG